MNEMGYLRAQVSRSLQRSFGNYFLAGLTSARSRAGVKEDFLVLPDGR